MTPADEIDIAYFSMEIAADRDWPTYPGGLVVLAGDFLRSAADRGLPSSASRCFPDTDTSTSTSTRKDGKAKRRNPGNPKTSLNRSMPSFL